MIEIATSVVPSLDAQQVTDLQAMTSIMEGWTGLMSEESVAATVYTFTMIHFTKSLFHAYFVDEVHRDSFIQKYSYWEFSKKMIKSVAEQPETSIYHNLCAQA